MGQHCNRHRSVWWLPAALWASAPLQPALAAPQTFDTALPVAQGRYVLRAQLMRLKVDDDPTAADREMRVRGAVTAAGYGLTPRVALFGVLPYLDKELDVTLPSNERVTRDASGIGDLRLFGRYTVVQKDGPGRTFRVAPILGFELPTGEDDARGDLGVLPQPLQVGSGSVDTFAGVVLTRQTLQYQVDAQLSYERNAEANGFELGDVLRLDASLQYRLSSLEPGDGVPSFIYGVIEANVAQRDKDRIGGVKDRDSGGTTLHLSPGIQYVTRRWIIEGILQIPVTQDLGGDAVEENVTMRLGFRINL